MGDASRYNVLTDGSLMIEDVKRSDAGVVECMARNVVGDVMSRPAELRTDDTALPQPLGNDVINGGYRPQATVCSYRVSATKLGKCVLLQVRGRIVQKTKNCNMAGERIHAYWLRHDGTSVYISRHCIYAMSVYCYDSMTSLLCVRHGVRVLCAQTRR